MVHRSWLRIIVEKPFGKDLQSSEDLSKEIAQYWPEEKVPPCKLRPPASWVTWAVQY